MDTYDRIFREIFGVDQTSLGEGFTFAATPEWDSLAHMELIAALEDEFDIMFEPDDITHFGGYENGKAILARYGVELV